MLAAGESEARIQPIHGGHPGGLRKAGRIPRHSLCALLLPCRAARAQEVRRRQPARRHVRCPPCPRLLTGSKKLQQGWASQ